MIRFFSLNFGCFGAIIIFLVSFLNALFCPGYKGIAQFVNVPVGVNALERVPDCVPAHCLGLFEVNKWHHPFQHRRKGDFSYHVFATLSRLFRNAGYVLAVELHAVNLAHAHARVEKEQQSRVSRKLPVRRAEVDYALFLCLGEGVALLGFVVRKHNLAHWRLDVVVVADYVEHRRHQHLNLLCRAHFTLVGEFKQEFLYFLTRYLVDVIFAEPRHYVKVDKVAVALVSRLFYRSPFDFQPLGYKIFKEGVIVVEPFAFDLGKLVQKLALHGVEVLGRHLDAVSVAAVPRLIVPVLGHAIGYNFVVDGK